jgi:hypothetical protein
MGTTTPGESNARLHNRTRSGGLRIRDYARVFVGLGILGCMYLCNLLYEKAKKAGRKLKGLWQEL